MDNGATISVLGNGSIEFLKEYNHKFHYVWASINTADSTSNRVEGYIKRYVLRSIEQQRKKLLPFLFYPI